ncbi:shikimate kinase, partial [Candidatus Aerophobetes bacterium]|nr:shikimate kinase [Candidatus Aerophobetes bacterium]
MNIVLVGFMGTGKSSVGKELSRVLGKRYIDVDEIIQKKENCSIPRIFAEKGEDYFRKVEEEVIREVSRIDESVISTGGGAVLKRENMENLKKGGIVICLKANLQTILERTTGDEQRPLLNTHLDRKERIKQLLKKRMPFYNKADIIIDTSSLSVLQTVDRIV